MEIFDRTFAITGVLRTLSLVVAFVGMLAALMALSLARARDRRAARARPDAAPGLGPRHGTDRRHRPPRRRARRAERSTAGRRPRLRHQPPLVRLDDVDRPVAVDPAPGRRAVAAGRAARRSLSRLAHGQRRAGRGAAR